MKIRNGFVSNSSSSSYIVSVPKGFTVTADELQTPTMLEDIGESGFFGDDCEYLDHNNIVIPQEAVDKVNELFAQLASGTGLYHGDWQNPCNIFWGLVELLEKHNLIVMVTDGAGGDGEDTIKPFEDLRRSKK